MIYLEIPDPSPKHSPYWTFRFNRKYFGYMYKNTDFAPGYTWCNDYDKRDPGQYKVYTEYVVHLDKPLFRLVLDEE